MYLNNNICSRLISIIVFTLLINLIPNSLKTQNCTYPSSGLSILYDIKTKYSKPDCRNEHAIFSFILSGATASTDSIDIEIYFDTSSVDYISSNDFTYVDVPGTAIDYVYVEEIKPDYDLNKVFSFLFDLQSGSGGDFTVKIYDTNTGNLLCDETFNDVGDFVEINGTEKVTDLIIQNELLPNPTSESTSQYIMVNGTLLVDVDYTFYLSEISMGPGAEIIIQKNAFDNPVHLDVLRTSIYGCDKMWENILVDPDCSIKMDRSSVEDAYKGLEVTEDNYIWITRNEFRNNIYGFYAGNTKFNEVGYRNLDVQYFHGNHFYGSSSMLEEYNGQNEYYSDYPRAGVYITNVRDFVVEPYYSVDEFAYTAFNNIRTGIISKKSNLVVFMPRMYSLVEDGIKLSGVGIHSVGYESGTNFLDVRDYYNPNGIFSTHFENLGTAVVSHYNNLYVENIYATEVNTGIHFSSVPRTEVKILNNEIEHGTGIYMSRGGAYYIDIKYNYLKPSLQNTVGMKLYDHSPAIDNPHFHVDSNEVFVVEEDDLGQGGIWMYDIHDAKVRHNDVFCVSNQYFTGIGVYEGAENVFFNNMVGKVGKPNPYQFSYTSNTSFNNLFQCNESYGREGVRIIGACNGTILRGNSLDDTYADMIYGVGGPGSMPVTGDQIHNGNLFMGDNTSSGYEALFFGDLVLEQSSQYFVNSNDDADYLASNNRFNWFYDESGQTFTCGEGGEELVDDSLPAKVANGFHPDSLAYSSGQNWTMKYKMYREFLELGNPDGFESQYLNANADSSFAAIADLEYRMDKIFTINDTVEYDSLMGVREELMGTLTDMATDTSEDHMDSTFMATYDSIRNEIKEANEELSELRTIAFSGWRDTVQTLKSELNQMASATGVYVQNMESVLDIQLQMLLDTMPRPDSTQESTLESIADQCVLSGGPGVLKARAMIDVQKNDSTLCSGLSGARIAREHPAPALLVYPNPTAQKGQLNIELSDGNTGETLRIYNIGGKLLKEGSFQTSLNIKRYAPGMYILEVITQKGHRLTQKVFIQ